MKRLIDRIRLFFQLWRSDIGCTAPNGKPIRNCARAAWWQAVGLTTPPTPREKALVTDWWQDLEHAYDGDEGWPVAGSRRASLSDGG